MPLYWIELGRVIGSYWILKLRVYMGLPLGLHCFAIPGTKDGKLRQVQVIPNGFRRLCRRGCDLNRNRSLNHSGTY